MTPRERAVACLDGCEHTPTFSSACARCVEAAIEDAMVPDITKAEPTSRREWYQIGYDDGQRDALEQSAEARKIGLALLEKYNPLVEELAAAKAAVAMLRRTKVSREDAIRRADAASKRAGELAEIVGLYSKTLRRIADRAGEEDKKHGPIVGGFTVIEALADAALAHAPNTVDNRQCSADSIGQVTDGASAADLGREAIVSQLREIVTDQANDEGLWFDADRAPEAYLQHALRDLHGVVERAIKGLAPDGTNVSPAEDNSKVVLDAMQDNPGAVASPIPVVHGICKHGRTDDDCCPGCVSLDTHKETK